MKKILISILFSGICLASGKLSLENQLFLESKVVGPTLGLTINEPIPFGLVYNGWTGGGMNIEQKWWMTSKHDIEIPWRAFTIAVGASYRLNPRNESDVHLKISYDLW